MDWRPVEMPDLTAPEKVKQPKIMVHGHRIWLSIPAAAQEIMGIGLGQRFSVWEGRDGAEVKYRIRKVGDGAHEALPYNRGAVRICLGVSRVRRFAATACDWRKDPEGGWVIDSPIGKEVLPAPAPGPVTRDVTADVMGDPPVARRVISDPPPKPRKV